MRKYLHLVPLFMAFSLLISCRSQTSSPEEIKVAFDNGATGVGGMTPPSAHKIGEEKVLPSSSARPLSGGWRLVASELDYSRDYFFAMLPSVPSSGARFSAYDLVANRVVCCAVVKGGELSEDYLSDELNIPGSWVNDLMNNWNLDEAPYRPKVVELQMVEVLHDYEFSVDKYKSEGLTLTRGGRLGGLLLPENSEVVGSDVLRIEGRRYTVSWSKFLLADDDGSVDVYSLVPEIDGEAIRVEVPYGTN